MSGLQFLSHKLLFCYRVQDFERSRWYHGLSSPYHPFCWWRWARAVSITNWKWFAARRRGFACILWPSSEWTVLSEHCCSYDVLCVVRCTGYYQCKYEQWFVLVQNRIEIARPPWFEVLYQCAKSVRRSQDGWRTYFRMLKRWKTLDTITRSKNKLSPRKKITISSKIPFGGRRIPAARGLPTSAPQWKQFRVLGYSKCESLHLLFFTRFLLPNSSFLSTMTTVQHHFPAITLRNSFRVSPRPIPNSHSLVLS